MRGVILMGKPQEGLGSKASLCGKPAWSRLLKELEEAGVEQCALAGAAREVLRESVRAALILTPGTGGSAGAARRAWPKWDGSLVVCHGQIFTKQALKPFLAEHHKRAAALTACLLPGETEKGVWIVSPIALALIPSNRLFELGKDLLPMLEEKGLRVERKALEGWDLDTVEGVLDAQKWLLEQGDAISGSPPDGRYRIYPPVWFGAGVCVEDGAKIGPNVVLETGCQIGEGTVIKNSLLREGTLIGDYTSLSGCLLGEGASVKSHANLMGCLLQRGAVAGSSATLRPGTIVTTGAVVPDFETTQGVVKSHESPSQQLWESEIKGEPGVELTPELAVKLGQALGTVARGQNIGLMTGGNQEASILRDALAAGARFAGASVMEFGEGFPALFQFCMGYHNLSFGAAVWDGSPASIQLAGPWGFPLPSKWEERIQTLLRWNHYARARKEGCGTCADLSGMKGIYQNYLLRLAPEGISDIQVQVRGQNSQAVKQLERILFQLGGRDEKGVRLELTPDTKGIQISQGETLISPQRALAICCAILFEKGKDVAVPEPAPPILDLMAQKSGHKVYRALPWGARDLYLTGQHPFLGDGLGMAVMLLGRMAQTGVSLEELNQLAPPFEIWEELVPLDENTLKHQAWLKEQNWCLGVWREEKRGSVLLYPEKAGTAIRILAEAANWEAAQELCGDLTWRIRQLKN